MTCKNGAWQAAHSALIWEQGVAGSNPAVPTTSSPGQRRSPADRLGRLPFARRFRATSVPLGGEPSSFFAGAGAPAGWTSISRRIGSAGQLLADASGGLPGRLGGFQDDLAGGEIDLQHTAENTPDDTRGHKYDRTVRFDPEQIDSSVPQQHLIVASTYQEGDAYRIQLQRACSIGKGQDGDRPAGVDGDGDAAGLGQEVEGACEGDRDRFALGLLSRPAVAPSVTTSKAPRIASNPLA